MPIDQIGWVLPCRVRIKRCAKAFRKLVGAQIVWVDIADQCGQAAPPG